MAADPGARAGGRSAPEKTSAQSGSAKAVAACPGEEISRDVIRTHPVIAADEALRSLREDKKHGGGSMAAPASSGVREVPEKNGYVSSLRARRNPYDPQPPKEPTIDILA